MKKLFLFSLGLICMIGNAYAEPSTLDKVLESKTLRVCTTGNYSPYTMRKEHGTFEGLDISMAQSLADSLDAKIEFKQISWKNLVAEFIANKCDIAVGGISITLERQQQVYMTEAMLMDRKVAYIRCKDTDKYRSLNDLNNKNVRVNEIDGDANDAFARKQLPNAQRQVFDNINVIRQNIMDEKADVVITDELANFYDPTNTICLMNKGKGAILAYGERGYMLPKGDATWKRYVDNWLRSTMSSEYHLFAEKWLN